MKNVVVIDGQGGKLGAMLVSSILDRNFSCRLTVIGTNSIATTSMLKAGAKNAATGENPVVVACRDADVIIGPIGIVAADSLLGEVTPKMALAVGQSQAIKLLLPVSHCNNRVVGTASLSMGEVIKETMNMLLEALQE